MSISVKNYGADGDGSHSDTFFAAALAEAALHGVKRIIIPAGQYLLTNFAANVDGIVWEGDGESTLLALGTGSGVAGNVINVSGARNTFRGMKLEGNGALTNSQNGNGFFLTGEDALFEDIWFTGMGHGAICGLATSAMRGPKIIRPRVRLTSEGVRVGTEITLPSIEIFLGGGWQNILIQDPDLVTEAAQIGINIYNSGAGLWCSAAVERGWIEGYAFLGSVCSDEAWDGSDRVFGFTVDGGYYKNIGKSAVKAKLSKGIRVQKVVVDSCGWAGPENGAAGLYGAILLNSIGQVDGSHNTLRNNGNAGIVINGNALFPKSRAGDGFGLASVKVTNNIIEGCGLVTPTFGDGIVMQGPAREIDFSHNSIRNVSRYGARIDGGSKWGITRVQLKNNTMCDSPTATHYAIYVKNAFRVDTDGNSAANFYYTTAYFENVPRVRIGPNECFGDSASAASCYLLVNCNRCHFAGEARNGLYPAWAASTNYALGDRVQLGGNVYECVTAGTSAGSGGPTGTSYTTALTDGTVQWIFAHKYKLSGVGIQISGTLDSLDIAPTATFFNLAGAEVSGSAPTSYTRPSGQRGTATLVSGTKSVTFATAEFDAMYKIELSGNATESFGWASKGTGGFAINSSNGGSGADVDWRIYR